MDGPPFPGAARGSGQDPALPAEELWYRVYVCVVVYFGISIKKAVSGSQCHPMWVGSTSPPLLRDSAAPSASGQIVGRCEGCGGG